MDDSFWWLIVGLALFVVELLTPGFVVACFGVGALLASLIALFGGGLFWQVFAFSVGSIVALLLLRPLLNHGKKDASGAKIAPDKATGMDALKGRTVLVVKQIDGTEGIGRIAVDGDEWPARANAAQEHYAPGERVTVLGNSSIVLIVTKSE